MKNLKPRTKKRKLVSGLPGHWGINIFNKSAHDKPLLLSFLCHLQYFTQHITMITSNDLLKKKRYFSLEMELAL